MRLQYVSIGMNKSAIDTVDYLATELRQNLRGDKDYCIDKAGTDTVDSGNPGIIIRSRNGSELNETDGKLVLSISNALSEFIIKNYEEKLISRIINTNYCYFNGPEKKEIRATALKIIRNEDGILMNSLFRLRRRNIIVAKVIEYLKTSNILILDGFINFRLKEYTRELEEIVDRAVDDYLMEREYKEFIRLLKYFVDMQDPKYEEVELTQTSNRKYILTDKYGKDITSECMREIGSSSGKTELNHDDLLVSTLITLAPKRIVIHNAYSFKNSMLLETIKSVFAGKILICGGCEACKAYNRNANKESDSLIE